jgi:hypothetical protein
MHGVRQPAGEKPYGNTQQLCREGACGVSIWNWLDWRRGWFRVPDNPPSLPLPSPPLTAPHRPSPTRRRTRPVAAWCPQVIDTADRCANSKQLLGQMVMMGRVLEKNGWEVR